MVRSGPFYPAGNWVVSIALKGMVFGRAEACWKMLTTPQDTNIMDVHLVFFEDSKFRCSGGPTPDVAPREDAEMHAAETSTSMAATLFQMAEQDAANRAVGVLELDQPLYDVA